MRKNLYRRGLALLLAACTLLASCGSKTEAATMHLRKTEGTVGVSDGKGKSVEPKENLGLYSGYGVDTRAESYAWVNLDNVKLTKLDQNSEIEIIKEDKHLTIEVKSGSLFFNVTEPLAEDESLNIRTSTMAVGIRGTCGWVEVNDPEHMTLYLLEGTVECTAGPVTTTVDAGKMAVMTAGTAGNDIALSEFSASDVPAFVLEEIEEDSELLGALPEGPGAGEPDPADPQDEASRRAALLEVLNNNGGATYAGLFDVDGDGSEDLLLLNQVGQYAGFRWTAYLWDGSAVQAVDLNYSNETLIGAGLQTTDNIYTVTAGVYRERSTGTLYVRYYGEVIGGSYSSYYVSTTGAEEIAAPFWGSYDGQEGGFEAWQQQKEQEQQEYQANLAARFETLAELNVGGFDGVEDYTSTIGEVRQQLEAESSGEALTRSQETNPQEAGIGQAVLEQYRQIIEQADSYEYNVWPVNANEGYRYALVQEEGFSVPTLILEKLGLDRNGFLLFRYNLDTGVTDEVGSDSVTRFEFPHHSFINEIAYDEWYDITDTSALDAWVSTL